MWIECQQQTTMARTVNANWNATRLHATGKARIASLLNTNIPTEHTPQLDTPATSCLYDLSSVAA